MNDHYFTKQPEASHDIQQIEATLRGRRLLFETDAGVFSKAGIDFGTRLLIETIEVPGEGTFLDVGCGYGPVGIAVAKGTPEIAVTMVDVNERAIELSIRNAKRNSVSVEVFASNGFEKLENRRFDVIATNPPIRAGKKTVYEIFEGAAGHLCRSGTFWVVIQKKQGAPSAKEKLESLFRSVEDVARDAGYRVFRCTDPLPTYS